MVDFRIDLHLEEINQIIGLARDKERDSSLCNYVPIPMGDSSPWILFLLMEEAGLCIFLRGLRVVADALSLMRLRNLVLVSSWSRVLLVEHSLDCGSFSVQIPMAGEVEDLQRNGDYGNARFPAHITRFSLVTCLPFSFQMERNSKVCFWGWGLLQGRGPLCD